MTEIEHLKKAIHWAEKNGISGIKANCEGYDAPTAFSSKDGQEPLTPDVTGKKFDGKYYIEIATKTEDVQKKVSKWKLLSTLAKMKGGKLVLMAPKGHKAFAEKMVKTYQLDNTQIVYLPDL